MVVKVKRQKKPTQTNYVGTRLLIYTLITSVFALYLTMIPYEENQIKRFNEIVIGRLAVFTLHGLMMTVISLIAFILNMLFSIMYGPARVTISIALIYETIVMLLYWVIRFHNSNNFYTKEEAAQQGYKHALAEVVTHILPTIVLLYTAIRNKMYHSGYWVIILLTVSTASYTVILIYCNTIRNTPVYPFMNGISVLGNLIWGGIGMIFGSVLHFVYGKILG
ncbi:hypothetical protein ECANGB1_2086 [Enterospora canceri]|uniref:Uncharacterized protein n=1 Tax=Enterospora canceri TaxID=1081671 RepID=A0A1Y1S9K5_9MICR|nr:hypothetical protein ECANGB1_2086 [Enterospora canceri]